MADEKVIAKENEPSALSSILAILGLVILVIIVIWGLVHLAGLSSGWFTSLFPRTSPSIQLSAPERAINRVPFSIDWNYATAESGSYAFIYQCDTDAHFATEGGRQIPCGVAYSLATSSALTLTPILSGDATTTLPYSVLFVPETASAVGAQVSASVRIEPAKAVAATPTTPVAPTAQRPQGPADLVVRIISVSADGYGNGTAVFDIANAGSGSSGMYYFQAVLPTNAYNTGDGMYTYSSPAQASLAPGDHVVSTLRFTQAQSGGVFSVTVDPANATTDSDPTNNYAYQQLVGSYNQQYDNNYNYQQPAYPTYIY